jgi:HSP20 family molecular chaperone IbpA
MEIPYGEFNVELHFNIPVDDSHIEAVYDQGFLRIDLPKARPKQIHITKE